MPDYHMELVSEEATGSFVTEAQFGANALFTVNSASEIDFSPSEGFSDAIEDLTISHLRYPGGHVENTLDITKTVDGQLRQEVRNFLDWCLTRFNEGENVSVTLVLTTKVNIPENQMEDFLELALLEYGEIIDGFEIGNEYSIGRRVDDANRDIHPEEIALSDFVSSMNEVEYGQSANRIITIVQNTVDKVNLENGLDLNPNILIQMADTNGAGSSYKGTGDYASANDEIISQLSAEVIAAIDGVIGHYYYNVPHDDGYEFANDWRESRRTEERYEDFIEKIGKPAELVITEWNVLTSNYTQLGLAGASVLIEMFEYMVNIDTGAAFVWPLQHRTGNSIAGDKESNETDVSISGVVFEMMSDSLQPNYSETGTKEVFQSFDTMWTGDDGSIELNVYKGDYTTVIYVSSRSTEQTALVLDIDAYTNDESLVSTHHLSIADGSSDGLSDYADENGLNRISKRYIDEDELANLETLPFFDASNPNHVQYMENGSIRTYLPSFDEIIPMVSNPQTIDDFYFATEADVEPYLTTTAAAAVTSTAIYPFELDPFEVVEITVDNVYTQTGSDENDLVTGGVGRDVILGYLGNDTLLGGELEDKLKGGWGNDHLFGGSGNDDLVPGNGDDVVEGGIGDDTIVYSEGADLLFGGDGDDTFVLNTSMIYNNDTYAMNVGRESQIGTGQIVHLEYYAGVSSMVDGGLGEDTLILGSGNDALFLHDTAAETSSFATTITDTFGENSAQRLLGIERIYLGDGDDFIDLTSPDFSLSGTSLLIEGGSGNDLFWGSEADEVIRGGRGDDTIFSGMGNDEIFGGDGADTFQFTVSSTEASINDLNIAEGDRLQFFNSEGVTFDIDSFDASVDAITISYLDSVNGFTGTIRIELAGESDYNDHGVEVYDYVDVF